MDTGRKLLWFSVLLWNPASSVGHYKHVSAWFTVFCPAVTDGRDVKGQRTGTQSLTSQWRPALLPHFNPACCSPNVNGNCCIGCGIQEVSFVGHMFSGTPSEMHQDPSTCGKNWPDMKRWRPGLGENHLTGWVFGEQTSKHKFGVRGFIYRILTQSVTLNT